MKDQLTEIISARPAGKTLARLGARHGYRFDGDTVRLHAMFTVLHAGAHDHAWALQLWACPVPPKCEREIVGQLVAEAALPPIGEIADDAEHFEVSAPALPPAGQGAHSLVLVLVSRRGSGQLEVQDWSAYSRPEVFVQPRLAGNVAFRLAPDRVQLDVERVENPRPADNLSGTLSLELWALKGSYAGGGFAGSVLAGVAFGTVAGQSSCAPLSFDLRYTPPAAGTWHFVLMLREWTAAGYVTRDFVNFGTPISIAEAKPEPALAAQPPAARVAPVKVQANPPAVRTEARGISVNSATVAELRTVKGLPTRVVEGIVKKRPFRSMDELLKVKGMGEKLLAKVRARLKL